MHFEAGHQRGDRGVPGTVVAGLLGRDPPPKPQIKLKPYTPKNC